MNPRTAPARPAISILLTSWNTREQTRTCLQSLRETAAGLDYEIIAVDNASADGSAELLAADPAVRLIVNTRNLGFAAAMNQAFAMARGELVLLLNSDIRFHPGSLQTMERFLRDNPAAAGVSPKYVNPDGSFQQHYVQLPSFTASLGLYTVLGRVPGFRGAVQQFHLQGQDFSQPRELASGSCMLLRTAVVRPAGLFDERFPIFWNDAVLARDLRAAGHRVWMIPSAVVTHTRGASCRLLGPAMRFRHLLGGLVGYLRLTEPRHRVWLFQVVHLADYLLRTAAGHSTALGWADLLAALRGDVGPLPDGDVRDWQVLPEQAAGGPDCEPRRPGTRQLLVAGPSDRHSRDLAVQQTGPATWRARLPTLFPVQVPVPGRRWLNNRYAAAQLRRWLDHQAGARSLPADDALDFLTGRLGHDVAARQPSAPVLVGTAIGGPSHG